MPTRYRICNDSNPQAANRALPLGRSPSRYRAGDCGDGEVMRNKMLKRSFYYRHRRRRGPAGPTVLISDTFTDANGTALASHAIAPINTPGASWSGSSGITIQSNRAQWGGGFSGISFANSGISDCVIDCVHNRAGNGATGNFVRASNVNNGWLIATGPTLLQVFERNAGSFILRASSAGTFATGADHALQITLNGTAISGTIGAVTASYTSATFQTNTNHGMRAADTGDNFDNFTVTEL